MRLKSSLRYTLPLACMAALTAQNSHATLYFSDTFDYPAGNLYGQGSWLRYGTQSNAPIQVIGTGLSLPGYAEAAGGSVAMGGINNSDEDLQKFTDTKILSGTAYASALINVNSVTDNVFFLTLLGPNFNALADGKATINNGRIFACTGTNEGKFKLGISNNEASPKAITDAEYELGKTYLIVLKYEFIEGDKNDILSLFVNPADSTAEPSSPTLSMVCSLDYNSVDRGIQGIVLMQNGSAVKTAPVLTVDAIKFADSWADLFTGELTGGGDQGGEVIPGEENPGEDNPGDQPTTPSMNVESVQLFSDVAAMGNPIEVIRYTIKAEHLLQGADIYLTGSNRNMFSLSTDKIEAGSSTIDVVVSYNPTAIGKHTARLNIETVPTELNYGQNFTFMAYDPQNPPSLTAEASDITPFTAKVGETQTQQFSVNTANFIDYGSAKVLGDSNGAFRINTTMLMKSGETVLRVTFAPTAEGTYTERIELSGIKADPVVITVSGSTAGAAPEEDKQGDELIYDTSNPLSLLVENFDNVERNKPFSISGWKNVAVTGTRSWWGYNWEDGNTAAKVTAYDSKVESGNGTPCTMMLLTPALDFNTEKKILTFRIMGDNLRDDQDDLLEVCYIDILDGDVWIESIKGLNIPVQSDYNGEWIDYVVNLETQDLADVFFIGFRFTSTRGSDNSAIYYIDDVTWGHKHSSGVDIVPQGKDDVLKVFNLQGIHLMDAKHHSELKQLPKGIYIVNGKKITI